MHFLLQDDNLLLRVCCNFFAEFKSYLDSSTPDLIFFFRDYSDTVNFTFIATKVLNTLQQNKLKFYWNSTLKYRRYRSYHEMVNRYKKNLQTICRLLNFRRVVPFIEWQWIVQQSDTDCFTVTNESNFIEKKSFWWGIDFSRVIVLSESMIQASFSKLNFF